MKRIITYFIVIIISLPYVYAEEYTNLKNSISKINKELKSINEKINNVTESHLEWDKVKSNFLLSGYGVVSYANNENSNDSFSQAQFSPIFLYRHEDYILFESELEISVNDSGGTDIELEYLSMDLVLNDYLILVMGKFLSPIGQFRQNLHPSWINKLPSAPVGYGHDQAAPLSDLGIQIRGGAPIGETKINYSFYVGNGPILELDNSGTEVEAIEAIGSTYDGDNKKVFGGRIGWFPIPKFEFGTSILTGKTYIEGESSRDYDVLGCDFSYNYKNLNFRGEYISSEIGNLASSVDKESSKWEAFYYQISYKFNSSKIESVIRYGDYDSPHNSEDQDQIVFGLNYLFSNQVVAKTAYEINKINNNTSVNEDRLLFQLSYGF